MIQVLVSPSAKERLTAAQEFVASFPPASELLLIGTSRDAADHLVRELSRRMRATFGIYRFSLTQFAARLATAEFARRGLAHLTPLGSEALAARATFQALERGALRYFAPVARRPGFARALASTLGELRLAGVDVTTVGKLGDPGLDLKELLGAFEEDLANASLSDRTAFFRASTRALLGSPEAEAGEDGPKGTASSAAAQDESRWKAMPILLLDVAVESPAERDFLAELVRVSPQVLVTIPEGDEGALTTWEGVRKVEPSTSTAESQTGSALARLQRHLFADFPPPPATAGDEVRFFSAPGEGRECVEIARRILEEARGGVRFDRVAILVRDPATYASLIETALARASIPAYFTRGTRRPDPTGRAFLALLACAAERLSAKRFAEYLSLGQVPKLDETGAPPEGSGVWSPSTEEALGPAAEAAAREVTEPTTEESSSAPETASAAQESGDSANVDGTLRAPWKWEELLVEAAVIGHKDRWARRLTGLEAELRMKLETERVEDSESSRVLALERDLRDLAHLRRFALPIIEALASLPTEAPWGEWLAELERLAPRVLRQPQRVLSVLAELKPMADVGPVGLDEVREALAPKLSSLEQEPPRRPYGRVFIGTPEQARGRSFEIVFVPGVAERIFPQRPREDPLLLDALRKELGSGNAEGASVLKLQADRLKRERLLLRLAAGAAEKRIHFSYPRLEVAKARQRVPSFYALDVRQATTGDIPRLEDLVREAESESEASLAWPAPARAADAIDDIEHDLAVLGGLLRGAASGPRQGRARYLLELNPHLARSLRTRWARWRKSWSRYDGLCEPSEPVQAALAHHRLRARPYSVTALQKFAVCPYQFLLYGVHRLEPREDSIPLVQIDPLTRGSIFHDVQAKFMRRLKSENALPVTLANLSTAMALLDEAVQQAEEEYREKLAPAILQVWRDGVAGIKTDLRGWLQRTAETPSIWRPVHFEFGIGLGAGDGRDPESRPEPATLPPGYQLRGVVDLIERNPEAAMLRVTDYKTGANRTHEGMILSGGEVLQPVLYGLAVEASLGEPVSEGRLYFCTSAGGFAERPVKLHDTARQRGVLALEVIDRALERVFLPPAPRDGACAWCDYLHLCGPAEAVRSSRKDPKKLEDLQTLRCSP